MINLYQKKKRFFMYRIFPFKEVTAFLISLKCKIPFRFFLKTPGYRAGRGRGVLGFSAGRVGGGADVALPPLEGLTFDLAFATSPTCATPSPRSNGYAQFARCINRSLSVRGRCNAQSPKLP